MEWEIILSLIIYGPQYILRRVPKFNSDFFLRKNAVFENWKKSMIKWMFFLIKEEEFSFSSVSHTFVELQ